MLNTWLYSWITYWLPLPLSFFFRLTVCAISRNTLIWGTFWHNIFLENKGDFHNVRFISHEIDSNLVFPFHRFRVELSSNNARISLKSKHSIRRSLSSKTRWRFFLKFYILLILFAQLYLRFFAKFVARLMVDRGIAGSRNLKIEMKAKNVPMRPVVPKFAPSYDIVTVELSNFHFSTAIRSTRG